MKISTLIAALFPKGYVDYEALNAPAAERGSNEELPLSKPGHLPYLCTDLFAIVAMHLQRSGAYHHVAPDTHSPHAERTLSVSDDDRRQWVDLGRRWRGDTTSFGKAPPAGLVEIWRAFWALRGSDVYSAVEVGGEPPAWWRPALSLLCIADEAAHGLGFEPPEKSAPSFQSRLISSLIQRRIAEGEAIFSFSTAETDLCCVLPKSRTPMVGCTLRSLTHNLALLPPRGLARAYWLPYASGAEAEKAAGANGDEGESGSWTEAPRDSLDSGSRPLNCLLIPMPFRVQASSIQGVRKDDERWGWFRIQPTWCAGSEDATADTFSYEMDMFWAFVHGLISEAERDVGQVHVLVFPEAALSSAVFRELKQRLEVTNVELLIAGLFDSTTADGGNYRHGNFAALGVIGADGLISYREKHHRWRLDRSQIQTYALGASLDPNYGWWEDIDILSRSLDVYVLRGSTTVTTLICEDLARHDPCQELVRGIGPNLVFALLMDGPQLKARWPARYATVLAEDPGSSVLSFTSLGLIERSNATGLVPASRMIGLWRDDRGETIELSIPADAQALCLSLQSTCFEEHTLDGRGDGGCAESWRLSGLQPVRLSGRHAAGVSEILAGRWPTKS
ncbi:MAG TPA: hypothetical protein VFE10_05495 [Phenylobacterium sp.]|jgi:hypothetical protein|nr:hypothetical protein [Phenylobacterium sp.]